MLIEGRIFEKSQAEKKFFEYYRHKEKLNRIRPKILMRHKKIIDQILKNDENKNSDAKSNKIQLDLFDEKLN